MPKPTFTDDDFVNPDAPEGERQLKSDHWEVRDLSYDLNRMRQHLDLMKSSIMIRAMDPWEEYPEQGDVPEDAIPGPSLELFIKERPRGPGYVADFLYHARDLPVSVYGILVNSGFGLEIVELELWRTRWGYWDDYGTFVDREEWEEFQRDKHNGDVQPRRIGITSDVLRRIPIGEIIARSQNALADRSWEDEGIRSLPGPTLDVDEFPETTRQALETANTLAERPQRGRPPLDDELLERLAHAYLREAVHGRGLTRRLAAQFNRPEPTIKDWVKAARQRGYLSAAQPGQRGAGPGPRLQPTT
ncbi:hypothetical protein [Saccharothrix deserti]|uniref:hypothetical protein n=1 Tax=Saccharothrix deserti TaxID=2593674 RepID=UPI00192E339E|nr:hypothetical protein [Saccharothrix deserti]